MTTGMAVFVIGILIVIGLILVGAAFADRVRGRRIQRDAPQRAHTDEELAERTRHESEQ